MPLNNPSLWDLLLGLLGSAVGAGVMYGALAERTKKLSERTSEIMKEFDDLKGKIVYTDTFMQCQEKWQSEIVGVRAELVNVHNETAGIRTEMEGLRKEVRTDTRQILDHLLSRKA